MQLIQINRYGMESVNVMAKISHGCGSVGSIRSQRRRIVSEPTDSLVSFSYWKLIGNQPFYFILILAYIFTGIIFKVRTWETRTGYILMQCTLTFIVLNGEYECFSRNYQLRVAYEKCIIYCYYQLKT